MFISSTFRDMQGEREILVKRVFPQLRKLCEDRGVTFTEVDLRWGITREQAERGEVLPICLAEIERCRPFFICLLGERYGWVPEEIAEELVEQEPWLAEHREKSVTELEIIHGVLRNPEMANRAIVYFRDPAYLEQIPAEQRAELTEDDPRIREKLNALKETIHESDVAFHDNYPNPETLGQLVLGESGSGKSALLANWALRYCQAHPDDLLLMHFIGGTPQSADWAVMLRRVLGELKRRFDIQQEIPDQADALRAAFANWLHVAAARGRVVLILDALNQLEDRDGAPDLVWLPPVMPGNIRLVLSTLPGRPLDDLQERGWPTLKIQPLEDGERRQLIERYLAQHTKQLAPAHVERIARADQAANPLYLRALLEELRVFGIHEQIPERIDHYLGAGTINDLYELILTRYEEDYDRDRPGLVRDAMTLIWAARRGLSEAELLELLGAEDNPLPTAYWSPLRLGAEQALVNRSGLIGFFHDDLRQAVEDRYLPTGEAHQTAHLRLAGYFSPLELSPRKIDELPWQLAEGGAWQQLYDLLADLPFFAAAWHANQFEVKGYWAGVESGSPLQMVDGYRAVTDSPGQHQDQVVWITANLLADMGHPTEAERLREYLVQHYRTTGDRANLAHSLTNQAAILYDRGDLDGAMALHEESERICRELGKVEGIAVSKGGHTIEPRLDIWRLCGDLGVP
ncbi:DUF4062 domain-containing protein [Planctomycetota bacterium]